jgi:hypothetical protein
MVKVDQEYRGNRRNGLLIGYVDLQLTSDLLRHDWD